MILIRLLIYILILFLLQNSQSTGSFFLKEILVIGNDKNSLLLRVGEIIQSDDGSIYVSDELAYKIIKFNRQGKKITEAGKIGNKDGEFKRPYEIGVFKNLIAVADFASSRIQIFDNHLKYLKTLRVKGYVFDLDFDGDGNLWVGTISGTKRVTLYKYNLDGNLLIQIKPRNSIGDEYEFPGIFSFEITRSNKIVIAHRLMNKIEIWNTDGRFISQFTIDELPEEFPKRKIKVGFLSWSSIPEGTIIKDLAVNNDERIFILEGSAGSTPFRGVFVYSITGKLIDKFILPSKSSGIYVNQYGELFSIENESTIIKKYSIK